MRKPIKDFEGIYEITDKGEVVTLRRNSYVKKERISKGYENTKGYLVFDFRRRGGKVRPVHRLVAETFIPNPKNLPQINHKDGDKTNNCVENLEWCDNSYNQLHAFSHNLQKRNFQHPNSKLKYEDVIYIKNNYQKGVLGHGVHSLAKKFNVCDGTIKEILNGQSYRNIN